MSIVIDPYMLMLPVGEDVNRERVIAYSKGLRKWEKEFSDRKRYVVSEFAYNTIRELNLLPTKANIHTLLQRFGITDYSAEDLAPTASGVLANSPRLEEMIGLYDDKDDLFSMIEYIDGSEVVIPEEIRSRMHEKVGEQFIQALILAGYSREVRKNGRHWSIATSPLSREESSELQVESVIEELCADEIKERSICTTWPLLFDPEHLYAARSVADCYQENPKEAVLIAWCKLKAIGTPLQGIDPAIYKFGKKFMESVLEPRIQRRPTLADDLEALFASIVLVLENIWTYGSDKHHALREIILDRSSEQQKRKRLGTDGKIHTEKAGRVEVTTGPKPIRLHYWQCYNNTYEFSNITDTHNDPTIYNEPPDE